MSGLKAPLSRQKTSHAWRLRGRGGGGAEGLEGGERGGVGGRRGRGGRACGFRVFSFPPSKDKPALQDNVDSTVDYSFIGFRA